ncbi:MAG: alanine racemase [Dysosmobacter sp.]
MVPQRSFPATSHRRCHAMAKADDMQQRGAEMRWNSCRVHIKVDTGMSRLGFLVRGEHFESGVNAIAAACALPGLDAEGIFTHFAVSDMDGCGVRGAHPGAVRRVHPRFRRVGRQGARGSASATVPTAAR